MVFRLAGFPQSLFAALLLCALAQPVAAITDWRRDGRVGYADREVAEALAEAFTAEGAPYEDQVWRVVKDPDGGFTPVFRETPPGAGS